MMKKRIALIDDERDILEITKYCLENNCKTGLEILTFTDPEEFLEVIKKINFDLVITDIQMPMLNGIELYKKIRNNGLQMSVIFNSGYIGKYSEELHNLIDTYYFSKPTNFDSLAVSIDNILKRSDKLRELKDKFVETSTHHGLSEFVKRYKLIKKICMSTKIRDLTIKRRAS